MRDFSRLNQDPQFKVRFEGAPLTDDEKQWAAEHGVSEQYAQDLKADTSGWHTLSLPEWEAARRDEAARKADADARAEAQRLVEAAQQAKANTTT